jgi:hypothetical protein
VSNGVQTTHPILEKVKDWLQSEGYPLEFRTAHTFQAEGIDALQGLYVRESENSPPREVDVLARMRFSADRIHFEVGIVVECKWSRDKPWVIFTASRTTMAASACVAQTIGSSLGEAVMHCLAASANLQSLDLFSSRERNGFGGRRAFAKEKDADHFYSTVQAVVSKASGYAYDADENRKTSEMPRWGRVAFPMIVLDGELFEAYYDPNSNDVQLKEVDSVRLHWRGSDIPTQWISTVDVVRFEKLKPLVAKRKIEIVKFGAEVESILPKFVECYKTTSVMPLDLGNARAARGYTGLPTLLRELSAAERRKNQVLTAPSVVRTQK